MRGAEISLDTLNLKKFNSLDTEDLFAITRDATDERIFSVFELIKRGVSVDELHSLTLIDEWFLNKLKNLAEYENRITGRPLSESDYIDGKRYGYTDEALSRISGADLPAQLKPVYRMVDTCAAEFTAKTPYFYGVFERPLSGARDEALDFINASQKPTVVVLGSGPIRIGQGIEFDYASVHCVKSLKKLGYQVVIINNNPETVSTDFDTADRLYFEPLCPEDVMNIIRLENPIGVVTAFGGQTAIKLAKTLDKNGINIIGTKLDGIDMAEDRERFDALLEKYSIKRPKGRTVMTSEEALEAAHSLGYPVLLRPSYVLGGSGIW